MLEPSRTVGHLRTAGGARPGVAWAPVQACRNPPRVREQSGTLGPVRTDGEADTEAESALAFGRALLGASAEQPGTGAVALRHARLRVLGVPATVFFRADAGELDRRARTGQPPILRLGVLEALMGLPLGEPVPESALSERERCLLRAAPATAVSRQGGYVVRRAATPLRVELAVVESPHWHTALRRAGRFPPTCARAAIAGRRPKDEAVAAAEADYYGIGLGTRGCGAEGSGTDGGGAHACGRTGCTGVHLLVPPAPARRRWTPVAWKLAETVLGASERRGLLASEASAARLASRPDA